MRGIKNKMANEKSKNLDLTSRMNVLLSTKDRILEETLVHEINGLLVEQEPFYISTVGSFYLGKISTSSKVSFGELHDLEYKQIYLTNFKLCNSTFYFKETPDFNNYFELYDSHLKDSSLKKYFGIGFGKEFTENNFYERGNRCITDFLKTYHSLGFKISPKYFERIIKDEFIFGKPDSNFDKLRETLITVIWGDSYDITLNSSEYKQRVGELLRSKEELKKMGF